MDLFLEHEFLYDWYLCAAAVLMCGLVCGSVAVNSSRDVYAAEVSFCECGKFQSVA